MIAVDPVAQEVTGIAAVTVTTTRAKTKARVTAVKEKILEGATEEERPTQWTTPQGPAPGSIAPSLTLPLTPFALLFAIALKVTPQVALSIPWFKVKKIAIKPLKALPGGRRPAVRDVSG